MAGMLKQRALSATLWSAIEQIGAKGLSTIFMLVFARYLSAEDFGIFAAATLAMGFASTFAKFGLDTVVVQRPELDNRALSTAFWMAFLAAVVMASVLAALAQPLAALFGSPEIAPLVPILALGMVIAAASAMVTALLRRELNMKALARRTLLANAISGVIATPFILNGFGAWGLVIQAVGGAVLTLILTLLLIGWPVRWAFDARVAREMLRFGAPVTGADLLTNYNRESPKIFVGFFLGVEALGIFAMAMRVMNLLLQVVGVTLTKVTLPVMSQVNRASPERMGEIYLRLVRLAGAIILPVFLLVIVVGDPLVASLLGPTWAEIVPIMSFLCAAGLLANLNYINGSTLVALGYPHARFLFSTVRALVGSIVLLIATPFGPVAAAAAFLLRGIIVEPMQLLYLLRRLKLSVGKYLSQLQGAALAALVMMAVGLGVMLPLEGELAVAVLLVAGSVAMAAYGLALFMIDKPFIAELRGMLGSSRNAL